VDDVEVRDADMIVRIVTAFYQASAIIRVRYIWKTAHPNIGPFLAIFCISELI
jgi:hypothetical protein